MANLLLADGRRLQGARPKIANIRCVTPASPDWPCGYSLAVREAGSCGTGSTANQEAPARRFPRNGGKGRAPNCRCASRPRCRSPAVPSTGPLFEAFQAEHERRYAALYKPEGLRAYRSYVRCELLPAFAGKRVDAITRQDVVRWFERYSARKPERTGRLASSRKSFAVPKHGGMYPRRGAIP
jgi:hypothetical protein